MWDDRFEEILRDYLPFLAPGEPLGEDVSLRDLGLDSISTVELLAILENTYDVRFLDDVLSMETFATPAVLWSALSRLAEAAA